MVALEEKSVNHQSQKDSSSVDKNVKFHGK